MAIISKITSNKNKSSEIVHSQIKKIENRHKSSFRYYFFRHTKNPKESTKNLIMS